MEKNNGVYIILNLIDCKVYVGESENLYNRTHSYELFNGRDNSKLQKDYDEGVEFIYITVAINSENKIERKNYEELYMSIFEDYGFELYNINREFKDMQIDDLKVKKEIILNELDSDFVKMFAYKPKDLVSKSCEDRSEILENYIKRYENKEIGNELINYNLFYNTKRIKNIIGKSINIEEINKDELFFSKVGAYIGEGMDIIFNYETKAIREYGYCLWTFGAGQIHKDTIQEICKKREELNKDTYVLFNYTPSSKYSNSESNCFKYLSLKDNDKITESDKKFLNLKEEGKGYLKVHENMDCTAKGKKSCLAFVIEDFYYVDSNIDIKNLRSKYVRINKDNQIGKDEQHYSRSTSFCRLKEGFLENEKVKISEIKNRGFQFVGKLASPYIVKLNKSIN